MVQVQHERAKVVEGAALDAQGTVGAPAGPEANSSTQQVPRWNRWRDLCTATSCDGSQIASRISTTSPACAAAPSRFADPALPIRSSTSRKRSGPTGNGTSNSVRHRSNPSSVRSSNLLSLSVFSRWRTLRLIRSDRVSAYTSCSSTTLTAGSRDEGGNQAASSVGSSRAIHRNSQASNASIIGASSPALPRSPSRWPSPSSRWGRQRTSPDSANTKRRARSCARTAVMRYLTVRRYPHRSALVPVFPDRRGRLIPRGYRTRGRSGRGEVCHVGALRHAPQGG